MYSKLNLKIEYPPPYTHKIWDYNRSERLNRSTETFDWSKLFPSKNIHERVKLFNKTLLNIFHNFIPNRFIACNDRDPAWMMRLKKWYFAILNSLTQDISGAITPSKLKYYECLANKVNGPKTAPKTY